MTRLYIVCEGQTEDGFVRNLLAGHLAESGVFATSRLLGPPGEKGGFVTWERVRSDLFALLQRDRAAFCTTWIDFYGRRAAFPGDTAIVPGWTPDKIAGSLEGAMKEALGDPAIAARFVPYVQMHEFEALLFSDPQALVRNVLADSEGTRALKVRERLSQMVAEFGSPEAINDGRTTAPSKRIERLLPEFKKVRDGIVIAKEIGLTALRAACPLFDAWITRLEALGDTEAA